ncbi:MAG: prepilin-type cleavage/methylation domain-containing protein [Rhodanobacteraceae bacterium]|nr:MAG: prepilin-type cleavage/methylation domain-containing protein [Rhodanobacteraceae bacterium]
MIAMVLGLVVIAGVTSVFLAGQQSFRTNNALAEVQDGSRIAFELMARDIRGAGLSSCDSSNGRIANVLTGGSANWFADWGNPVHGYPDGSTDPALSGITGAGAPVAGIPSLHIISAGSINATVSTTPSDVAANLRINQPSQDLHVGDIIVVCTLTGPQPHTSIVQITGPGQVGANVGGVVVVHNTGAPVSPGNCSKGLDYPTVCGANGSTNLEPNSPISKVSAADWYIGTNAAGGKSLYRLTLNGFADISASPSGGTPQEMVRNVTGMQITYLQPPNTALVATGQVTDWSVITAVRVTLTLDSTFQRATVNAKPVERVYAATTTIRNRVD